VAGDNGQSSLLSSMGTIRYNAVEVVVMIWSALVLGAHSPGVSGVTGVEQRHGGEG
jgi:hypothetical protein